MIYPPFYGNLWTYLYLNLLIKLRKETTRTNNQEIFYLDLINFRGKTA